ncbi:hypothetical protein Tco_0741492 [Tanacetum coccineum]
MVNGENSEVKPPPPPPSPSPSYLEVKCTSTKKVRRFSVGTEAAFALKVINAKAWSPVGLYIEAVKDGEESVSFGPNSVLVSYGEGWKLQTVMVTQGKYACRVSCIQIMPEVLLEVVRLPSGKGCALNASKSCIQTWKKSRK